MPPSIVPGIPNVGNSCFLNVTLQSMSACPELVDHSTQVLAESSDASRLPVTQALLNCLVALQPPPHSTNNNNNNNFLDNNSSSSSSIDNNAVANRGKAAKNTGANGAFLLNEGVGIDPLVAVRHLLRCAFPDAGTFCAFSQEDAHEVFQALSDALSRESVLSRKRGLLSLSSNVENGSILEGCESNVNGAGCYFPEGFMNGSLPFPLQGPLLPQLDHAVLTPRRDCDDEEKGPRTTTARVVGDMKRPRFFHYEGYICPLRRDIARADPRPSPLTGLLGSNFVCSECGFASPLRVSPFFDVQIPLYGDNNSLAECYSNYTKPEEIDGVRCDGCSGSVLALKRMRVLRVPQVLVFLFQRLCLGGKSERHVQFPLRSTFAETHGGEPAGPHTAYLSRVHTLVAVIEHLGVSGRGHYTVFRRVSEGSWVHISDARVVPVSVERVLAARAYMLFYSSEV